MTDPSVARGPAGGETITQAGELRSARVESLRAIAALAVLQAHVFGSAFDFGPKTYSSWLDRTILGGGAGVWLFFALSGYLLFWPFVRHYAGERDRLDLRRYALNRALRILPLYYAVLIVVMVLQEDGGSAGQWWRYLLFAENFSPQTISPGSETVVGTMWSLVVELHFYALLPLLALALFRIAPGRTRVLVPLLALGLASLLLRLLTFELADSPDPVLRYSLPSTFFFFVAGMAVAPLRLAWQRERPGWLRGPLARADVWLLASIPFWALTFRDYDLEHLFGVASFLMVGACVLPLESGPLLRALSWRPLAAIGVASYSLYLWHVPIVDAIDGSSWRPEGYLGLAAITIPVCLAVALLSYRSVEAPFLALRRRWADGSAPSAEPAPARVGAEAAPG